MWPSLLAVLAPVRVDQPDAVLALPTFVFSLPGQGVNGRTGARVPDEPAESAWAGELCSGVGAVLLHPVFRIAGHADVEPPGFACEQIDVVLPLAAGEPSCLATVPRP